MKKKFCGIGMVATMFILNGCEHADERYVKDSTAIIDAHNLAMTKCINTGQDDPVKCISDNVLSVANKRRFSDIELVKSHLEAYSKIQDNFLQGRIDQEGFITGFIANSDSLNGMLDQRRYIALNEVAERKATARAMLGVGLGMMATPQPSSAVIPKNSFDCTTTTNSAGTVLTNCY